MYAPSTSQYLSDIPKKTDQCGLMFYSSQDKDVKEAPKMKH